MADLVSRLKAVPVLGDLTPEGFEGLAAQCTVRDVAEGEIVFREGDYGFEFYVVLEGAVRVVKTTATGGDEVLATIQADGFFGEMGPMVGQPRSATVVAGRASVLLEVDHDGFSALVEKVPSFKRTMDEAYLDRALASYLQVIPLFRGVPAERLKALAAEARLVSFQKDAAVIREGEAGDAFYLIRRGFVKVTRAMGGVAKVLAYLRENGWFGEMALIDRTPRTATVTALGPLEVVRIGRDAFEGLCAGHPEVRRTIEASMAERRAGEQDLDQEGRDEKYAVLVEKGLIQVNEVLAIDLDTCTRCGNCETNCAITHDGYSRLVRKGFRVKDTLFPASCYMCPDPECMKGCRFGVLARERDGSVYFRDHCTGCQACVKACPYGVITMAERAAGEGGPPRHPVIGLLQEAARGLFGWGAGPAAVEEGEKPRRMAVKCDMCKGLGMTACLSNCPTGSIMRVSPQSLLDRL
ncbi:MAG: cyclic nucleotide-binding domain-containing protein [Planctomycetes bacterium]|nr:cyclic nucleotide-binding domain-containing protein [Planctomycetota bacterium]